MQVEPLCPQREAELFRAWRNDGDEHALAELITSLRPFVLHVAKRYRGEFVTFDDLVAAGLCGAVEASRRFDPTRGARFLTYAGHWIRAAILDELRTQTDHGLGTYEQPVASLDESGDLDRALGAEALAEAPLGEGGVASRQAASVAHDLLGELDERSRRILTRRFLGDEEVTLATVATEIGLSRERVRQLETRALARLRKRLARAGFAASELLAA